MLNIEMQIGGEGLHGSLQQVNIKLLVKWKTNKKADSVQ